MTISSVKIGRTIKLQRITTGMTLKELSARSGVSSSYLSRVERGQRFPSSYVLLRIARPLGKDTLSRVVRFLTES